MGNFSVIRDPDELDGPDLWAFKFMQTMNARIKALVLTDSSAFCGQENGTGSVVAITSIAGVLPILVARIPVHSTAFRGKAGQFLIRLNDAQCEHRRCIVGSWLVAIEVIIGHAILSGAVRKVANPAFPDECDINLN